MMLRLLACLTLVVFAGCTGGATGDPSDDAGDLIVLTHSPGNGDQVDQADALDGFNALNNPTLINPGAVTIVFTASLDPTSVLNPDPADPQGTRNVRLFRFDPSQGPFDPLRPSVPGANPPGANILVPATTTLTATRVENDTLVIRPDGISAGNALPEGQYSATVAPGVRGADGDGMKGAAYFFFFCVGRDTLGPVVMGSSPAPGERNVPRDTEVRITMSETVYAGSVNTGTLSVSFQPAGTAVPIPIPGRWYVDGGNGPGNNYPSVQLDHRGLPGFSGSSPRNGADIVFRPDLDALPVNMAIEDLTDASCQSIGFPPRKGNRGFPIGQAVTVSLTTEGATVTDTAGNPVPEGSPNTTFAFFIEPAPPPVYAPGTRSAVYYGDTIGVGVIDVDPGFWPYVSGPNPPRLRNSVVTVGSGAATRIVRVPVPDLVDIKVDTRAYSAFYTPTCGQPIDDDGNPLPVPTPTLWHAMVYALSGSASGGEVVVIDSSRMQSIGRFSAHSPGGLCITARGAEGRLVVTHFSSNTATVYDIGRVSWIDLTTAPIQTQAGVLTQAPPLLLDEDDFIKLFPHQRPEPTSPPGPPIIGTVQAGVSPTACDITELPGAWGGYATFSASPILAVVNSGESTVDFTELLNLNPSRAIAPDRGGVSSAAPATDLEWTPVVPLFGTGRYFCFISTVGGTVDLFITGGGTSGRPSVGPNSSRNYAPNAITNSLGGFQQPSALQYAPNGNAIRVAPGAFTASVLVAETGANRVQQLGVTSQYPTNVFQVINTNHSAGTGPVDLTGAPRGVYFSAATGFFQYYVANAGAGTVREASYVQSFITVDISVPGVFRAASWWSQ